MFSSKVMCHRQDHHPPGEASTVISTVISDGRQDLALLGGLWTPAQRLSTPSPSPCPSLAPTPLCSQTSLGHCQPEGPKSQVSRGLCSRKHKPRGWKPWLNRRRNICETFSSRAPALTSGCTGGSYSVHWSGLQAHCHLSGSGGGNG